MIRTTGRALWVSTSTETRGGVATYVRAMQQTPLWTEWNIRHVTTHRDGSAATKLAAFALGALQFVVELVRFRPSVVHLHSASGASFVRKAILFWISRMARIPVVIHMHGAGFQEYYENSPRVMQAIVRATLCRASAFVALGETWASRVRAIVPTARITAIPNAVRLASQTTQPLASEPVRVVFLGRIGNRKGAFRLLDAWAEVARDPMFVDDLGKAATLTIAGDGEVERARQRIRELDLEDTVEVHEWLSEVAVGELLDHAQVLVLPSRQEGQPMAVLEAMARGLCIIASDVGGLVEMIGDECGVIVEPDDIAAIADAIRLVVHDVDIRARYGCAAYRRAAAEFDLETVWRRIDTLYGGVAR